MYKNLKLMIVEHWGAIILTIGIIISLYFVLTEVILTTSETTETVVALYNVIDNSTADIFDNKIVQGSQVLTTIKNEVIMNPNFYSEVKFYDNKFAYKKYRNNR